MKIRALLTAAILALALGGSAPPCPAAESPASPFALGPDGAVSVDGLSFPSMSAYVQSQYFQDTGRRCLVKHPPPGQAGELAAPLAESDCDGAQTVIRPQYQPYMVYTIAVAFHVISKADGTGDITDQQIIDQMTVLNEDFRAMAGTLGGQGNDAMIQFELKGITRTANDTWFSDNNEYEFKAALAWDQSRYLNIYSNSAGGYLGYSYMPWGMAGLTLDGVVLNYWVVGGRDQAGRDPYEQGRTATHEVGHYLGLLHTFHDYVCANSYTQADLIMDTNAEVTEHYGCSQTSTCDSPDPIHNYMDYTDDTCMQEFTPEQINRMICSLATYRPLVFQVSTASPAIDVLLRGGGSAGPAGAGTPLPWLLLLTGQ